MKMSSFAILAALAMILALGSGCATSGPEYERSAFHQVVAGLDHPLREGVVENGRDYSVTVSIDGGPEKSIPARCFTTMCAHANAKSHFVVKAGSRVVYDGYYPIYNEPLGHLYVMPGGKGMDTGWIFGI